MHRDYQVESTTAWHYIFAKPNPRLLKYQLLTAHTHAATVEDQFKAERRGRHPRRSYSSRSAPNALPLPWFAGPSIVSLTSIVPATTMRRSRGGSNNAY